MKRLVTANPPRGPIFACAALFWCSFTLWFIIQGVCDVVVQWRTDNYTATTGTMTHAKAVRVPGRGHGNTWRFDLRYSYVVGGQSYESTRLRYDPSNGSRADMDKLVAKYAPHQLVTVYYNPAAAADAVLEIGVDWMRVVGGTLVLTPFAAAALGFAGFYLSWPLSRWLGRPVVAVSVRDNPEQTRIRFYENSPALQALAALGLVGVLSIFGAAALTWLMALPPEIAVAIAWLAMLTGMVLAWWQARLKYVELRRDHMRGTVEVGQGGSKLTLAAATRLELAWPKRRDPASDLPLPVRFVDASQRRRTVRLPRQTTQEEASEIIDWLNRLLGLPSKQ
jgi:hypothetical protein